MVMCGHGWWWGRGWGGPSHFTYPLASHTTTHHHHPHPQSPTSPYTTTTTSPHLHTTTTCLYHYHHHLLVKPPSATYHHSPTHNTTTHSPPITTAHRTHHPTDRVLFDTRDSHRCHHASHPARPHPVDFKGVVRGATLDNPQFHWARCPGKLRRLSNRVF